MNALVQCPKCQAWLLEGVFNQPGLTPCPACGAPLQVEIFPALFRPPGAGRRGEAILAADEASCFYHPAKKAVVPCQACGRFLCALCDCELQGRHLCTACLESGKTKGKIENLEDQRTLYDSIALALSTYPLLIFYLTLVTAPAALWVAIRYWKAPLSIVHRTKFRFVIAMILSLVQVAGWTVAFFLLLSRRS